MGVYPLLRTTFVCWVPDPPAIVRGRLEDAVALSRLTGTVDVNDFALQYPIPGVRNSWRPRLYGQLAAVAGGTRIDVTLSTSPFVAVFTFVHGLFLFGLSWVMGIAAFSWEVGKATAALVETVGATAVGEEQVAAALPVSDPTQPGAETEAPYALRAIVGPEGVGFRVPGRPWLGTFGPRRETPVEVLDRGVTIDASSPPLFLAWERIERCDLAEDASGRAVVLGGAGRTELARIPCDGLSPDAAMWFASYLDAHARRRALPDEDRRRQDAERARLAALVRDAGGHRE